MSKEQLIFDPSVTDYKDEHDIVGSMLIDENADVITAGDGDSDDVANTFNAHDARAFAFAYDAGGDNWDRLRATNGALHVDIQDASINVDLTQADEVTVFQGTDPWIVGDGGGSLTVDAVQLDIDDLNATDDAVAAWTHDGAGNAITSTTGFLDVNIAAASGIGIFDEDSAHADTDAGQHILAVRQDSLAGSTSADGDYGSFKQTALGELYVKHVDDINVTATQLDIDDLDAATDSVEAWMKDGNGDDLQAYNDELRVTDLINTLANSARTDVGSSGAVAIKSTAALTDRKWAWLFNNSKKAMYVGAAGITSGTGFPMPPKSMYEFRLGAAAVMNVLGTSSGDDQDFRLMEGAA